VWQYTECHYILSVIILIVNIENDIIRSVIIQSAILPSVIILGVTILECHT